MELVKYHLFIYRIGPVKSVSIRMHYQLTLTVVGLLECRKQSSSAFFKIGSGCSDVGVEIKAMACFFELVV